jgi:hypothetical protein
VIDLGTVRPGTTIRIPYSTFAGSTGASVTQTGLATSDVQIYKDGGTTQRASTAGFTVTTDFDTSTGLQLIAIDLADNTTAGFYAAGSEYLIAVADVTVDSQTVRFWLARFSIGYPDAVLNTTVATLASQTSFTLTAGSADNSAYIGCPVILHDVASAVQMEIGFVSAYTGSTKTVTLAADPGIFTVAAGDNVSIMMPANVRAFGGTLVTARDIGASVLLSSGTGTGQVSLSSGLVTLAALTHTGAVIPTVTTLTNLPAITTDWLTGSGVAASAVTKVQAGLATPTNITAATGVTVSTNNDKTGYSLTAGTGLGNQTANITGNLSGSVNSVTTAVTANVTQWLGTACATPTVAGVPEVDVTYVLGSVATGNVDPFTAVLPGSYTPGQAGYIIGTNLNATVSSRVDAAGVRTAVGLASANLDAQLAAIDDYVDTEVAAIKAKTDLIPASPAAVSDIPTTAQIADKILGRNVAGSSDGGRTVSQALYFLRNRWVVSGGTLTVYATDDSTASWTSTVTTSAGNPVTASDPA